MLIINRLHNLRYLDKSSSALSSNNQRITIIRFTEISPWVCKL